MKFLFKTNINDFVETKFWGNKDTYIHNITYMFVITCSGMALVLAREQP